MAHGYMREFDEDYGREDDRDRERSERDWRARGESDWQNRERGWKEDRYWSDQGADRDRGFMFGGRDSERGFGDDFGRRNFRSHPDDHYRSWRDKQMEALDRDYEDYCREREQQFHQDFDSWRQQRGNPGPLRTGMTQTGLSADPSGLTQAEAAADVGTTPPDPMDTATLGTTPRSRGRR